MKHFILLITAVLFYCFPATAFSQADQVHIKVDGEIVVSGHFAYNTYKTSTALIDPELAPPDVKQSWKE